MGLASQQSGPLKHFARCLTIAGVSDHSRHRERSRAVTEPLVCDLPEVEATHVRSSPAPSPAADALPAESRCYKFRHDYRWEGIPTQPYKEVVTDWARAVRCVLVGAREEATDFHLRYFELAPEGYTSLEKHAHAHVIVTLRGKGIVIAGQRRFDVTAFDAVYIAPGTPHQFINAGSEPFGFLCIVDAVRDRPCSLTAEEIERLRRHPQLRDVIRVPSGYTSDSTRCERASGDGSDSRDPQG